MTRLLRLLTLLSGVWLMAAPASAQFDTPNRQFHDKTTFRLEGKHLSTPCASCHLNEVYKGTPRQCVDCHWVRRQDDRFKLQLGRQCEQCHRPTAWTGARFDHAALTSMPLGGAHRQLACQTCHKNGDFRGVQGGGCVSCHLKDYQAARTPNHVTAAFPTTCEVCHRVNDTSFHQAGFNHAAAFPLVGPHATQTCAACHANGVYKGTARDCVGCHRTDYNRTTTPNHAAAGFSTDCQSCHKATESSFRGAGFNHTAVFALVGQHATQTCTACHVNNVYKGTARDCVGCHRTAYDRTTTPNHAAAGFSTDCQSCHKATESSFRGAGFNHAAVFALVGQHATQTCTACHINNVYKGTARDCVGCHRTAYDRTTTPNHAAAGFSTDCQSCHKATDSSFRGASFNHAAVFPLVGQHASQTCTACHVNSVFKGTARDCVGCHRAAYNKTSAPNHAAAGFSTDCQSCHKATDSSFRGASFNHAAVFPLVGQHATQTCAACHANGVYKGTARDCVGCHRSVYDKTSAPNHAAAGFSTDCQSCHKATDNSFRGASFNHAAVFPLVGQHASQTCTACHANGVYKGTARDCLGCHRSKYDRTSSPNHAAAGFSTDCQSCHRATDSSWGQGTFNHRFPIASGRHKAPCSSCHQSGTAYANFTCLTCHEHAQASMDSKHRGRNGYRYESRACYSCHPTGRGD